jgi:hypothetical protein
MFPICETPAEPPSTQFGKGTKAPTGLTTKHIKQELRNIK